MDKFIDINGKLISLNNIHSINKVIKNYNRDEYGFNTSVLNYYFEIVYNYGIKEKIKNKKESDCNKIRDFIIDTIGIKIIKMESITL
jgi:hypothetical protein